MSCFHGFIQIFNYRNSPFGTWYMFKGSSSAIFASPHPLPLIDGVSAKDSIELLKECFLFAADSFGGLCRPEKKMKKKKKEVTKVK